MSSSTSFFNLQPMERADNSLILKNGLLPIALFQKKNLNLLLQYNCYKFRKIEFHLKWYIGFPLPPPQQIPNLTFLYSSFFSFIPSFSG